MIKISKSFYIEPSDMSFGFHLHRDCVIQNKKTGETRIDKKLQGYDMSLERIIHVVSQEEALCEKQETVVDLLRSINEEIMKISEILKSKKRLWD